VKSAQPFFRFGDFRVEYDKRIKTKEKKLGKTLGWGLAHAIGAEKRAGEREYSQLTEGGQFSNRPIQLGIVSLRLFN